MNVYAQNCIVAHYINKCSWKHTIDWNGQKWVVSAFLTDHGQKMIL
jgi:hypothetical protein